MISISPKYGDLTRLNSIANFTRIFSTLPKDISINVIDYLNYGLKFKRSTLLLKDNETQLKLYWERIEFIYQQIIDKNYIEFFEDSICITKFDWIIGENLSNKVKTNNIIYKSQDTKIFGEGSFLLIPLNNLACVKFNWEQIIKLLENDSNKRYFKSISSNTEVIITLNNEDDVVNFDKISEFIPDHVEIWLDGTFYSSIKNIKNKHNLKSLLLYLIYFKLKLLLDIF